MDTCRKTASDANGGLWALQGVQFHRDESATGQLDTLHVKKKIVSDLDYILLKMDSG